jgi:hypothetical protein
VLYSKRQKGKMQDNQEAETSTDKVQSVKKKKKSHRERDGLPLVSVVSVVLSGRSLCGGSIPRPEQSYRL